MVFFRDPLERFLSAYLNKCVRSKLRKGNCIHFKWNNSRVPTFNHFIRQTQLLGLEEGKNLHFVPQYLQCGNVRQTIGYFDFIGAIGEVGDTYEQMKKLSYRIRWKKLPHIWESVEKHFHINADGTYTTSNCKLKFLLMIVPRVNCLRQMTKQS